MSLELFEIIALLLLLGTAIFTYNKQVNVNLVSKRGFLGFYGIAFLVLLLVLLVT